jgi:hypothetical protein
LLAYRILYVCSLFSPYCSALCRREFFYSESLAAGSHNQLPAPLGRNLADAWTKITAQNNRKKVLILLHDVYFYSQCDSQIHITTVVRPQFAGSGEPATKAITLYYWLHNDITIYGSTMIHFVLFLFLFIVQQHMLLSCFENPQNK